MPKPFDKWPWCVPEVTAAPLVDYSWPGARFSRDGFRKEKEALEKPINLTPFNVVFPGPHDLPSVLEVLKNGAVRWQAEEFERRMTISFVVPNIGKALYDIAVEVDRHWTKHGRTPDLHGVKPRPYRFISIGVPLFPRRGPPDVREEMKRIGEEAAAAFAKWLVPLQKLERDLANLRPSGFVDQGTVEIGGQNYQVTRSSAPMPERIQFMTEEDNTIRPDYYKATVYAEPSHLVRKSDGKVGCIVECEDIIESLAGNDFDLGNVYKYLFRAGKKSPSKLEDLKKAQTYLDFAIKKLLDYQYAPKGE